MVILGTIYQTLAGEEPFCLTSSIMCLHSAHVSSTTYSLRKPSPDRRNRSRHAIDCQLVGLASTRHSSTWWQNDQGPVLWYQHYPFLAQSAGQSWKRGTLKARRPRWSQEPRTAMGSETTNSITLNHYGFRSQSSKAFTLLQ